MNRISIFAVLTLLPFVFLTSAWGLANASGLEGRIDDMQCYGCHKSSLQTFKVSIHSHAFSADAQSGCQSCHGDGAAHKEVAGEEEYTGPLKIEAFKRGTAPAEKNRPCLTCHENNKTHTNWRGSAHDVAGVSCADCHTLHATGDTVPQGVCFTCHQTKRAQSKHTRNPMMPRADGAKECANCHEPHGGKGPSKA